MGSGLYSYTVFKCFQIQFNKKCGSSFLVSACCVRILYVNDLELPETSDASSIIAPFSAEETEEHMLSPLRSFTDESVNAEAIIFSKTAAVFFSPNNLSFIPIFKDSFRTGMGL